MDASRVLGTLRAHCDRLELELRELDADIEEAKAMVRKMKKRRSTPNTTASRSDGASPPRGAESAAYSAY
jgi:phage shock protein A